MVSWWTWILQFKWTFILARNYIGFVVVFPRMQNVRSHVVRETVRSESNRPRVLRDQKVLPEVRNRPLLLRAFIIFSIFKKLV